MYDKPRTLAGRTAAACKARMWGGVRWLMRALIYLGWYTTSLPAAPQTSGAVDWVDNMGRREGEPPRACGKVILLNQPPSGHPESLAWPAPLSDQERALWAQMEDRGG